MQTVVKIKFGSHLYGTNTEQSDVDWKSVHIPDAQSIILQRVKDSVSLVSKRAKTEGEKNLPGEVDHESYSLQRYLGLLAEGQTPAIDMLFAPNPEETSPLWTVIYNNREKLLTKKAASFVGYCRTQANKYGIKGSRVAAAREAMEFFRVWNKVDPLEKVGYVCAADNIPNGSPMFNEFTKIVTKETTPGHIEKYFECCNRMVGFKNTVKEAYRIFSNIYQEYGERARKAEANEGIDWKALSHAVRVGNEALELLHTGHITFPLPMKNYILAIKQGKFSYQHVADDIEQLLVLVEQASKNSKLREEPDYQFIDQLVYQEYYKEIERWA